MLTSRYKPPVMKNILVPTDFSATSLNAAHYALKLAEQLGSSKVILFNAYQVLLMIDPTAMVPSMQMMDEGQLKAGSKIALDKFKLVLQAFCPKNCELDTYCEYALLNNGLDEVCKTTGSGLIVMGITGGGLLEEKLIGSNTIHVALNSSVPVLIIPAKANFTIVEEIALACDFRSVVESTPVQPIKDLVKTTGAQLFVLNIEENAKTFDAEIPFQSKMIDLLLHECHPQFSIIDNPDFMEGINNFILEKQIDILITIPKKHGIFQTLFKESHTKKLAFHSHVPVMVVHD